MMMRKVFANKTMPSTREKHTHLSDEGAYQVDLVVAFFSILLVLFVVYSAHAYSEIAERSRVAYHTQDTTRTPFKLKSFSPLYPYRDIWVARNGKMARISLSTIVNRVADKWNNDHVSTTIDGIDIIIRPKKGTVSDFFMKVYFITEEIPSWISDAGPFSLKNDLTELKKALLSSKRSILIFIWPDQLKPFSPLQAYLREQGIPFSMFMIHKGRKSFSISYKRQDYGLENVLRPY